VPGAISRLEAGPSTRRRRRRQLVAQRERLGDSRDTEAGGSPQRALRRRTRPRRGRTRFAFTTAQSSAPSSVRSNVLTLRRSAPHIDRDLTSHWSGARWRPWPARASRSAGSRSDAIIPGCGSMSSAATPWATAAVPAARRASMPLARESGDDPRSETSPGPGGRQPRASRTSRRGRPSRGGTRRWSRLPSTGTTAAEARRPARRAESSRCASISRLPGSKQPREASPECGVRMVGAETRDRLEPPRARPRPARRVASAAPAGSGRAPRCRRCVRGPGPDRGTASALSAASRTASAARAEAAGRPSPSASGRLTTSSKGRLEHRQRRLPARRPRT